MADLANWIADNAQTLIASGQNVLLPLDSAADFFEAIYYVAYNGDTAPLTQVLANWVASRPSTAPDQPDSLVPVLAQLKRITGDLIYQTAGDDALDLFYMADAILTDALAQLAALELDAIRQGELPTPRAHDVTALAAQQLKPPLTLLEGYAGMLRSLVPAELSGLRALTDGIDNAARRLREIAEDLQDLALIDQNALVLHRQPVYLHHLLDAAERSVGPVVHQRRQTLVIDRESIPRQPIDADPERLLQVILKILSNAVRYTPEGGGIHVSGHESSGFLTLNIADTGVGIALDRQANLFGGAGLGLRVARGVIAAHGGSLSAHSEGYNEAGGPGSTFSILIPLAPAPNPSSD